MKKAVNICLILFFVLYSIGQFSSDVKMLSRGIYLGFIALSVFWVLLKREMLIPIKMNDIIFFIYLLLSMLYGVWNGFYLYSFNEMFAFVSLWVSWKIIFFSYENKLLDIMLIQKYLYYMMILWFSIYIFVGLGAVSGLIPESMLIAALSEWIKNRGMPVDEVDTILRGADGFLGLVPRLSTGLNIVPLIILLLHTYRNKGINLFVWILAFFFVLIDYGRFDVFVFVLATSIAFMFAIKRVQKWYWGQALLPAAMLVFSLTMMFLFADKLVDFYQSMFASDRTYASNLERIVQYNSLMDAVIEEPFLGAGMGAYIANNIRNDVNYWEYELQMLAFVYQLGIVGVGAVVINFISDYLFTIWKHTKGYHTILILIYGVWIVASCIQGGIFFDGKIILPVLFFMSLKSEGTVE